MGPTLGADLAIIVPMLGRAHRVAPLVESIRAATPAARVVFCTSPGDTAVERAVDATGYERLTVAKLRHGDWARKINAGYRHTTEPYLFTGADDLCFHVGWYEAALARLGPGIGVVGTNDLGSPRVMRGDHATHVLVTRAYADEHGTIDGPGAVVAECYPHEYVDDELVGTARYRGAWAFAVDAHVEHLHPDWGKAPTDPLYQQQRHRMRLGRRLFLARSRRWT